MCKVNISKSLLCELAANIKVNSEIFILNFFWNGPAPKAGQFFMLKPERTSVFLCRPISIFEYDQSNKMIKFLIAKKGQGTEELSQMRQGERTRLTGPLGNTFAEFLNTNEKIALVGGSAGVAPLAALVAENESCRFHFYAGFKNGFEKKEEENAVLGYAKSAQKLVVTAEDGKNAIKGRIVDFLEPENYDVIFACGSTPMIKAVKEKVLTKNIPLFVSMESRMACGTGACLGCTIRTKNGNKRCCADGPIFPAGEIIFND
jgi:NAD(P)H-flavin reductase